MSEATVEVLTAEVRALMVGNRQVTLSVYRQLDEIEPDEIEPFGRIRDSKDHGNGVAVIGRHRGTGALAKARCSPRRFRPGSPGYDVWKAQIEQQARDAYQRWESEVYEPWYKADTENYEQTRGHTDLPWSPCDCRKEWQQANPAPRYPGRRPDLSRGAYNAIYLEDHPHHAGWKALPLIVLAGLR